MTTPPPREAFTRKEWNLIQSLRTPRAVQSYLSSFPYNWEPRGATLRSFREVIKRREAHCLEAALVATVILEQHGYPPLVLSLESQDKLDHVVFIYKQRGRWGSIARSRDLGLHGRAPVFRSVRDLSWSYFDTFIDFTGRLVGYGVGDLREMGNYDWRFSAKNVWKVERYLCDMPHNKIKSSDLRYHRLHERFKAFRERYPNEPADYYDNRHLWVK